MASRRSAGVLLYRIRSGGGVEVLLAHMGGPFWARRDAGAWSIPKGEYGDGEEPLDVARREFLEELGHPVPAAELRPLGEVRQTGGKQVVAWAGEGDLDPATAVSNTFELEWPPRSGVVRTFPEVDRAGWFTLEDARGRLVAGQVPLLDALERLLG
jgi:predicted NUDIX family NTP pyrophosphohydrolase